MFTATNFTAFANSTLPLMSDPMAAIGFTSEQLQLLRTIARILSGISITGLILVQFAFWFFRSIRTFAFELVAWLCFSNVIFNISNYFPVSDSDDLNAFKDHNLTPSCAVQASLNILFDLSSLIWTTIIGYTAYLSVTHQESLEKHKMRYRLAFILFAYVIPLIFTLIVLLTASYGPSGVFCWIATEFNSTTGKTLTTIYYSSTWCLICLNAFFVVKVILLLRKELRNEQELVSKFTSKLRLYPLVQIVSYIPATINRIFNLTTGRQNFTLMLLQIIFDCLTGLAFSMVYGMNSTVTSRVKECVRLLCCKNKIERKDSSQSEERNQNDFSHRTSRNLTFIDDSYIDSS